MTSFAARSLGLLSALCLVASPIHAQQFRHTELSFVTGIMPNAPKNFSNCGTTHVALAFGVRGGYRPSASLVVEATLETYADLTHDQCPFGLPPAPAPIGLDRREMFSYSGPEGFPPLDTGLRLGWTPVRTPAHQLRISGGIERAWRKNQWAPTLGMSGMLGAGKSRMLLDVDLARFSALQDHTTVDFFDGRFVSSTRVKERHNTLALRLRLGVVIYGQ